MVVQHNLRAMNSNRMLGLTSNVQAKSTEKLSSGYKINRAADDAAGLSISEKMRKQIRGLSQASLNAADGISAVQTAEGALNEVQDMLQRMNELAVKASNGTMSETDRNYIQDEIDQLVTEIDRVAETTKFNETYLLKGTQGAETKAAGVEVTLDPAKAYISGYSVSTGKTLYVYDTQGNMTTLTNATSADEFAKYIDKDGKIKDGYSVYTVAASTDPDAMWGAQTTALTNATITAYLQATFSGICTSAGAEVKASDLKAGGTYFDKNGVYLGGLHAFTGVGGSATAAAKNKEIGADCIDDFVNVTATDAEYATDALTFKLHVGADSEDNNQISVDIQSMDATGLGLKTGTNAKGEATLLVNGVDDTNARNAISTIKDALQKVSEQRSALGAVQNRLEHTIANLDNVVENTTAAESQIRDTDMATEMVKYSNNNILAQAGQAMLAQANQANQGVLSLLG